MVVLLIVLSRIELAPICSMITLRLQYTRITNKGTPFWVKKVATCEIVVIQSAHIIVIEGMVELT